MELAPAILIISAVLLLLLIAIFQDPARRLFGIGGPDIYKDYEFPDPYNYERQGAFWTCEGCSRIARKHLSSGNDALRCEHCGRKGYWVKHEIAYAYPREDES